MLQDAANIAIIIGSSAIIGVFIQLLFAHKQLKADHERSRRENSVELLLEWTKNVDQNDALARRIVESLSDEETRNLYNQDETKVSIKYKRHLISVLSKKLPNDDIKEENDCMIITGEDVTKLRWIVMRYLNLLESILVAWQYSIVDRDIIEHQFSYLFVPEHGHEALRRFRIAAGGEKTFPAIEVFTAHIDERKRSLLKEKANVA